MLLVEDDSDQRELFAQVFRLGGFDVVEADNVDAAVEAVRKARFHVVVADMVLGTANALDLLKAIRDDRPTLAVLVTGLDGFEASARLAGFDIIKKKPIDPRELVSLVRHEMDRRRSEAG